MRYKSAGHSRGTLFLRKCLVPPHKFSLWNANLFFRIGCGAPDFLGFATVLLEDRQRHIDRIRMDHVAKSDAHIENLKHFSVFHLRVLLYEGEDRMRLDQPIYDKSDICFDSRQIEQA